MWGVGEGRSNRSGVFSVIDGERVKDEGAELSGSDNDDDDDDDDNDDDGISIRSRR